MGVFNLFQEIEDADAKDQNQMMIPDVQRELMSAHTDSEDGWSDTETRRTQQHPGMLVTSLSYILYRHVDTKLILSSLKGLALIKLLLVNVFF